jgi:rubrerythrin
LRGLLGFDPISAAFNQTGDEMKTTLLQPTTRQDLRDAMQGEAFAYLKYRMYADAARARNNIEIADLFERIANVEWQEHFAEHAGLAELVGSDAENLRDAIEGENHETTIMYPQMASRAEAAGDTPAAAHLREVGEDEAGHRDAFRAALRSLNGQ